MSCKLSDKCDNVFACNILRPEVELLGCNFYKPKKPMTNEEWLKSLDTEQLAKRLHDKDVYAFFVCRNGGKVPSVEHYIEWLKEKHHAE